MIFPFTITEAAQVIPNNNVNFPVVSKGLYIGTGGDVHVMLASGSNVIFKNLDSGCFLQAEVFKVYDTSTTASDIVYVL